MTARYSKPPYQTWYEISSVLVDHSQSCHDWLIEEIGFRDVDWEYSESMLFKTSEWHRIIRFKREEDKVKFILRWM